MDYWWWLGRSAEIVGILTFVSTSVGFLVQRLTLKRIEAQNELGGAAIKKLERIRRISDGKDESIWSRTLGQAKLDYHRAMDKSIPIIMVANLKGGVGKTTIAANLAAYFASPPDAGTPAERVLVIDMDYQGSLTALMDGQSGLSDAKILDLEHLKAEHLLSGQKDGLWLRDARSINNTDLTRLHYIGTDSNLADSENRLLVKWLLDESDGDIRLNLANVLLSSEVQKHFDRIIIDTAPRMTLGFVAAACCSTHVLVPTVMNQGSARSVKDSLSQLDFLRRRIATHMDLIGIVASKTKHGQGDDWIPAEQMAVDDLKSDLRRLYKRDDLILEGCKIRDTAQIRDAAGYRLAYLEASDGKAATDARPMFAALGAEVRRRAPGRKP